MVFFAYSHSWKRCEEVKKTKAPGDGRAKLTAVREPISGKEERIHPVNLEPGDVIPCWVAEVQMGSMNGEVSGWH